MNLRRHLHQSVFDLFPNFFSEIPKTEEQSSEIFIHLYRNINKKIYNKILIHNKNKLETLANNVVICNLFH